MLNITNEGFIELYNIIPVYRGSRVIKYMTSISMEDINKVYDKLTYDIETQRGMRKRKVNRKDYKEEYIMDKKNIEEMKYKLRNEFFDGGTLSWNVRVPDNKTHKDVVEFYPLENKIIIKGDKISIPDSYHRHKVINELSGYTTSIDQKTFCFPLAINLYDFIEEQALFSECNNNGLKAPKTRGLYLSSSIKNQLLKEIVKNSKLNGNVELNTDTVFRKDKIVTFGTLYASLFDKNRGEYRNIPETEYEDIKDWLIRFYDHLIDTRYELAKLSAEDRDVIYQSSIVNSAPMWYAYAKVSKILFGDTNWKRKISRLNNEHKIGN